MNKTYITDSAEKTQKLGAKFARVLLASLVQGVSLSRSGVVALYGNLGSGKTTFVQGLAKGLEIKKRIISPTFIIIRTYNLKSQISKLKTTSQNLKSFHHIDLYRVENEKEVRGLGIEEIIQSRDIVAIEWAEKIKSLLPKKRWDVRFEDMGGNRRKIIINQKL